MHRTRLRTNANAGQENVNLFRTKSQLEAQCQGTRGMLADRRNANNLCVPSPKKDLDILKRPPKHEEKNETKELSSSSCGAIATRTRLHDNSESSSTVTELTRNNSSNLSLQAGDPKTCLFDIVVFAPEYMYEINQYLLYLQKSYTVEARHLSIRNTESKITARHRGMLVDWIVHAGLKCAYQMETIFLAIQILDRFLQAQKVDRNQLQCYTATVVWLAAKYEEVFLPDPDDLLYYCGNEFELSHMIRSELEILRKLDFRLNGPVPYHFLRMYARVLQQDSSVAYILAKYIMLTAQLEYSCASMQASDVAAGSLWIARNLVGEQNVWPRELSPLSNLIEPEAAKLGRQILPILVKVQTGKTTLTTIQKMFSKPAFRCIATSKYLHIDNLKRLNVAH